MLIDVLRKLPATDLEALEGASRENATLLNCAERMGGVMYAISAVNGEPNQWVRAAKHPDALGEAEAQRALSVFLPLSERAMGK